MPPGDTTSNSVPAVRSASQQLTGRGSGELGENSLGMLAKRMRIRRTKKYE